VARAAVAADPVAVPGAVGQAAGAVEQAAGVVERAVAVEQAAEQDLQRSQVCLQLELKPASWAVLAPDLADG
jgi:hypothetical protein